MADTALFAPDFKALPYWWEKTPPPELKDAALPKRVDALVVQEASVGKALVMKRFSPRARGRVGRILKPFSNLTVVVREVEESA